jgi:23S rRNA (uracil1939-C5)-methyltransferase
MDASSVIELLVERPVAGGRMLARHDGRVALVSGAIPGERVRARVERTARSVVWAETVEVLDASGDRRAPICDPSCGGALYAHIAVARQRQLKAEIIADAFRRIGKMTLPAALVVAESPETGYRLRARLHVRGRRVGFFREGSHVICDAGPTGQLHEDALVAIEGLSAGIRAHLWECDSLIVVENIAGTERVIHLVPRESGELHALRLAIDRLPKLTGLTLASDSGVVDIAGAGSVSDSAADLFGTDAPIASSARWMRRAASFFQANRFLVGSLVRRVLAAAEGETCVDLYSGVGLFAVALAARGVRVTAVESDATSAADLSHNARPWDRLSTVHLPVELFLRDRHGSPADVIVVDPPRAGVSAEALHALIAWRAPRVVYVSCDPPTLARDAALLASAGYQLESVDAFDLFPNTPHVETVAVFTSSPAPRSPSNRAPA